MKSKKKEHTDRVDWTPIVSVFPFAPRTETSQKEGKKEDETQ